MKSLLKISLLFALIIAGRYMQLTTPAATAGLVKTPVLIFTPVTTPITLAHYFNERPGSTIPVGQREANHHTTWF
jgi:hypothetical protein